MYSENIIKFVNGYVLMLLVCSCYRFPFYGRPYSRALPLVQNMDERHLKSSFEIERSIGFGEAVIVVDGFPVTQQYYISARGLCKRLLLLRK